MNEKVSIQSLFNILVTFFLRSVIDSLVYNVSCADPEYFTDMGGGGGPRKMSCLPGGSQACFRSLYYVD